MLVAYIQPAVYIVSLALVEGFKVQEKGQYVIDSVDVTCGLSLGEYTALTFVGAFRCVLLSFLP
jgi:[acyl-carrier-protein] S-malonyltransferase